MLETKIYQKTQATQTLRLEITQALKTMNLTKVKTVFKKHKIENRKESQEFLETLKPIFENWKKPNQGSILKHEVTLGKSRCMGCEFGKDVLQFTFKFQHTKAPQPRNQIVYSCSFGVLFNTENDQFKDIRVCNAFLSKKEMEEISDC